MESFQLTQCFKDLNHAKDQFITALLRQNEAASYLSVEGSADFDIQRTLEIVANSLGIIWYQDKQKPHINESGGGVICVDDDVLLLADQFNIAKLNFRNACKLVSGGKRSTAKRVLKSERHGLSHHRDDHLSMLLKSQGLSQIDLWKCYKRITIISDPVYSIGWTWQREHSEIKAFTVDAAIKLCQRHRSDDSTFDAWAAQLLGLRQGYKLARVIGKQPQLRANIYYEAGRKTQIPSPSIILLAKSSNPKLPKLPKKGFKTLETVNGFEQSRCDKRITDEYALGFLNFYAYPEHLAAT